MFKHASVDVGCGEFTWQVEKPPKPERKISLGKRKCHESHNHQEVHKTEVDVWSRHGCQEGRTMNPDSEAHHWKPQRPLAPIGGLKYDYYQNFKVSWIDGCEARKEQNVQFPTEDDRSITCEKVLAENYMSCECCGTISRQLRLLVC